MASKDIFIEDFKKQVTSKQRYGDAPEGFMLSGWIEAAKFYLDKKQIILADITERQCELLLYSLERLLDQYIEDYKNHENDIHQFAKCVSQLNELHVLINQIKETNHE